MLRRAEVTQARVRLGGDAFQQRGCQPRLADARFTGEQHHLPFAGLRLRPAAQQEFEFFFAPDKLGQPACVERFKAALDRRRAAMPPKLSRDLSMPLRS